MEADLLDVCTIDSDRAFTAIREPEQRCKNSRLTSTSPTNHTDFHTSLSLETEPNQGWFHGFPIFHVHFFELNVSSLWPRILASFKQLFVHLLHKFILWLQLGILVNFLGRNHKVVDFSTKSHSS